MKGYLIGFLLMLCLLFAGCTHPDVDQTSSGFDDSGSEETQVADMDSQPSIEQPPEDDGNESLGDESDDTPDDGDDGNEVAEEGDDDESAEQSDSDGDGVPDEEDQCSGEDDTIDDDASGEPDCTENQT